MKRITVPCVELVSWNDPVRERIAHYQWYTPIHEIPEGINLRPNVRVQDTSSPVYRSIRDAQLNIGLEPKLQNSYNLGSGGITIITTDLQANKARKATEVSFLNGGNWGIPNGAHQYRAALENKEKILRMIEDGEPIDQYMPFHAIVNMKRYLIHTVAKALNTNVQVTNAALLNNLGVFDSIKVVLEKADILQHFGCLGNEKKVKKLEYEISENVVLMEVFNRHDYPDGTRHPTHSVGSVGSIIAAYGHEAKRSNFAGMLHLLPDFWRLFEQISMDGYGMINASTSADNATWAKGPGVHDRNGNPVKKRPKVYKFPILGTTGSTKLAKGPAFAMMSALRQFLVVTPSGKYSWEIPFERVVRVWKRVGPKMVQFADDVTQEGNKKASDTFKTDSGKIWTTYYKMVQDHRRRMK